MKKILSILLLITCSSIISIANAQNFNGSVKNEHSNAPLSEVEILTSGGKYLAKTNDLGDFNFSFNADELEIIIFLNGYELKKSRIHAGTPLNLFLKPLENELNEARITEFRGTRGNNSFSYSVADLKKIPTIIGEADVMQYLQILPGISQGMEGGLGFFVRGAGTGNNRVELDGIPIIGPTHMFGFFSSFHADIVDKSTFQMGGISSSSGDLLSSLLQIETLTPEVNKYKGSASLSPMMLDGALQGYLVKNKLSFQIAGRTSLLRKEFQAVQKIVGKDNVGVNINPQMQDLYAKLHWNIHPFHTIDGLIYGSHDCLKFMPVEEDNTTVYNNALGWDNRVAKLTWNYTQPSQFRIQTSAYYSNFKFVQRQSEQTEKDAQGFVLATKKTEKSLKSHFFTRIKEVDLNGGIEFRSQQFSPVMQKILINKNTEVKKDSTFSTTLASAFGEVLYETKELKLKGGLRYSFYRDNDKRNYHNLDVHLHGSTFISQSIGVEATYDRLTQYQHTLEGLPVGWALDLIAPASQQFHPEKSNQWYLGGFWGNNGFYATVGAYYRQLSNLTSYKSLLNQFTTMNISWEQDLAKGKGSSYGLEIWLEKRNSRWTGSIAYTLSKTMRQFDEINEGKAYPFKFDRPHNLKVQTQYITRKKEHKKQYVNASIFFSSGNNITIPVSNYKSENLPFWDTQIGGIYTPPLEDYHADVRTEMSSVNGYRLPNYFRIDVGYSFLWTGRKLSNELTISLFNILNRKNSYLMFYDDDQWYQLSILPIVPSIRWEVRF